MNESANRMHTPRDWNELGDAELLPAKPVVSVIMLAYNHGPFL
jgi:hypothetical protein